MDKPRPPFSMKGFMKGSYQKGVEAWALKDSPVWSWSVKAANQLVYALTGEVSLDYGTTVQGGNDGYLWQPSYLAAFNRTRKPPREKIVDTFRKLKVVQDFFRSKGVPLVAVINPNLIMLYPELLPEKYKAVQDRNSSYEVAREAISRWRPDVVDAFQLLRSKQHEYPFRFFEPTGSHWNEVGSCIAAREISGELATAWNEEIPQLECDRFSLQSPPRPADVDLVQIANLLDEPSLYREAPYLANYPRPHFRKPRKILLIGTSFLFALEQQLLKHHIAESTTLLFYFSRVRQNGTGHFTWWQKKEIAALDPLAFDAIIIDANVAGPGIMGYGFLDFAMSRFNLTLPPVEQRAEREGRARLKAQSSPAQDSDGVSDPAG